MDSEKVSSLRAVLAAYQAEHDWDRDEDPTATWEMVGSAREAVAELEKLYRPCLECGPGIDATGPDGLCDRCRDARQKFLAKSQFSADGTPEIPF